MIEDLKEVQKDLNFIIERENERIEPLVAARKFPIEQSIRVAAKEALAKLDAVISQASERRMAAFELQMDLMGK